MTFQSGDHSSHLYRNRHTFSSIFVYIDFKYSIWSSLKMLAPFLKGSIPLKYFSRPWEENSGTFRIKAIPISCFCSTEQLFLRRQLVLHPDVPLAGVWSVLWELHPHLDGARTHLDHRTSLFFPIELYCHIGIFKRGPVFGRCIPLEGRLAL